MTSLPYSLEQLFVDQDPDLVADTIAPVLAWVPGRSKKKRSPPYVFPLEHTAAGHTTAHALELTWDRAKLAQRVPGLVAHVRRLRSARSAQREHVTELAAYGLSFVAISLLMPGRRVMTYNRGMAPDLLFDTTPNELRGVETAGRATGGRRALTLIRDGSAGDPGKRPQLLVRTDIAEVSLSLWCGSARTGIMEQVKP